MESLAADLATMVRTPLAPDHVARMREVGQVVDFKPGDTIAAFGSPSDAFFYVEEGQAAVYDELTGEQYGNATIGPTQFSGEISFLTGGTAMLTTRAVSAMKVLRVEREAMLVLMAQLPEMSDIIVAVLAARRRRLLESNQAGLTVIGADQDRTLRRIVAFASQNRIPFRSLDLDDETAARTLRASGLPESLPAVIIGANKPMADPTPSAVARHFGLDLAIENGAQFDLLIVGGGPAGVAAGVYAGAEGIRALVIDELSIGGQAGTSSRIENYLGFPTGISGADLCWRGEVQAMKFGTRFAVPRRVASLERDGAGGYLARLDDGRTIASRAVVIATGVQYRKLPLERLEEFEGVGVYYAATDIEARYCRNSEVVVIGGGNSAGQAAMFLSRKAACVHMLVRGSSLAASMSEYLIGRIRENPSIRLRFGTEVSALHGSAQLDGVTVRNRQTDESEAVAAKAVFVMAGAAPNTGWLSGLVALDRNGFVLTGPAVGGASPFATSCPGIFAVGDVRAGSVKRVASSVGEGSVAISKVWEHLNAPLAEPGSSQPQAAGV